MTSRKRKGHYKDIKCVFFPDENGFHKAGRETASLSSASTAKSWEKCGDSFLDSPPLKNFKSSGRKLSTLRKSLPALAQTSGCSEDSAQIAWSSSDSEQCDDETQDQHPSRPLPPQRQYPQRPERTTAPVLSYTRALRMLSADKDDPPVIDTDSDLDESEEEKEKDSGQQISDCESFDVKSEDSPIRTTNMTELEISGYVSDGEGFGDTVTSGRLDSESSPPRTGEGSKRSVRDWVRSAQAMLQTPQKQFNRQSKTPEDSAKKKRKFQSGGLAERLNRLQSRQRSAVSFWRHQSISDTSTTTTVDRPGALVLEVLEVQEECSMQLAHCEHKQTPGEGHQRSGSLPEERARVLVLFNRETAAQLIPAPGDVIHIYPPWQSLSIDGFSCDIILNTHFSQKVCSASKPDNMSMPRGLLSAGRCSPYSLCKTFGLLEVCRTTEEDKQVAASDALYGFGGSRVCVSLLEAIEGLGQAGSVGQDVEVVVQRVYSVPVPDCSPASILKSRAPSWSPSAAPPTEKGQTRLCALVQDSFGTFSEVQLHVLPRKDDLLRYCLMWQGRTCLLRGIKVVQRATRERRSRLFILIDSLWPPVKPHKDHGKAPSVSSESHPAGPAPSFCYLLSGQESSVEPAQGSTLSPLYLPPTKQTLQDILQSEFKICRCSFVATVIYKRITQSSDVGQGEVWLVLTDPSLQEEQPERPCRRTVALCVNTSCALTSSVLEALNSPAACHVSFRDAIKEHGVLLCAEQSVVEMCSEDPEGSLESSARPELLCEPRANTLPQPVRLDPLTPEITPNSLCSVTGVIVGVDENSAYSWPVCNHCGSDNLQMLAERLENFHCVSCKSAVNKPDLRFQLEVFLSSSLSNCTLKIKVIEVLVGRFCHLWTESGELFSPVTILFAEPNRLAPAAAEDDRVRPERRGSGGRRGYDVESVLGKEVGPLAAYVRVVTRKPALWIGLEEISL